MQLSGKLSFQMVLRVKLQLFTNLFHQSLRDNLALHVNINDKNVNKCKKKQVLTFFSKKIVFQKFILNQHMFWNDSQVTTRFPVASLLPNACGCVGCKKSFFANFRVSDKKRKLRSNNWVSSVFLAASIIDEKATRSLSKSFMYLRRLKGNVRMFFSSIFPNVVYWSVRFLMLFRWEKLKSEKDSGMFLHWIVSLLDFRVESAEFNPLGTMGASTWPACRNLVSLSQEL